MQLWPNVVLAYIVMAYILVAPQADAAEKLRRRAEATAEAEAERRAFKFFCCSARAALASPPSGLHVFLGDFRGMPTANVEG